MSGECRALSCYLNEKVKLIDSPEWEWIPQPSFLQSADVPLRHVSNSFN